MAQEIIDAFHKLFYDQRVFKRCKWLGTQIWKNPLDLWLYQEIIFKHRPEFIIETGSYRGASARFMANMMQLSGYEGLVISIDINPVKSKFPNVMFLTGNSVDQELAKKVKDICRGTTMVVLDSDHSENHVTNELGIYADCVTSKQYLIVEDTNLNGHPVFSKGFNGKKPGPMEAVNKFLQNRTDFKIDNSMHKLLLTMHPGGFLIKS